MKKPIIYSLIISFFMVLCGFDFQSQAQVTLMDNGVAHDVSYYKSEQMKPFYQNGQKKEEGYFKYGRKCGKWVEWHENGQRKSVKYYDQNGLPSGKWTYWYETGKKWNTLVYKEGIINGRWTYWYNNGGKWHELTYANGEVEGKWTFWHKNGKVNDKGFYEEIILKG